MLFSNVTSHVKMSPMLANIKSELTPSVRTPPGPGGGHGNQLMYGPPPGPGGSLYAAVFAPLMLKCSGLSHPFIR